MLYVTDKIRLRTTTWPILLDVFKYHLPLFTSAGIAQPFFWDSLSARIGMAEENAIRETELERSSGLT